MMKTLLFLLLAAALSLTACAALAEPFYQVRPAQLNTDALQALAFGAQKEAAMLEQREAHSPPFSHHQKRTCLAAGSFQRVEKARLRRSFPTGMHRPPTRLRLAGRRTV